MKRRKKERTRVPVILNFTTIVCVRVYVTSGNRSTSKVGEETQDVIKTCNQGGGGAW